MHDVIVVDEEYEASHARIAASCAELDTMIDRYCGIMSRVASLGAISGATSEALKAYLSYAEELKSVASEIAEHHGEAKSMFLSAIDNADRYLY